MAKDFPRWTDAPQFRWTPEQPLHFEPAPATGRVDDTVIEPRFTNAHPEPPPQKPQPKVKAKIPPQPAARKSVTPPRPANSNRAPNYFAVRLMLGLLQGLLLLALFQNRDSGFYFSRHPDEFSAAATALAFAPLLLLQGLGRVAGRVLVPWTALAALLLAALGFYQYWRGDSGHSDALPFAMAGLFLFVGQALITAAARPGRLRDNYAATHEIAWMLAVQVFLCALFAGLCWALLGAGDALLRTRMPSLDAHLVMLPVVTLAAALGVNLTPPAVLRPLKDGLLLALTALLPLAICAAAIMSVGGLMGSGPGLAPCLVFASLLLLCINASGRGEERPRWRKGCEFAGAFFLLLLTGFGAQALTARVLANDWTAPRIVAAAGLFLLACYALSYGAAALQSLRGGRWMQHAERANLALAFVLLALLAALVSPLGDPVKLAVASQAARAQNGIVAPQAFDFDYLRRQGLAFGHDTLLRMASTPGQPALARGAFMALAAEPGPVRPAPTEIGANINVRSGGALPATLLARDWRKVPDAPPCLSNVALSCDAYFIDMDGDRRNEIVLVYGDDAHWWAGVMKQGLGGGWYPAGTIASPPCPGSLADLRAGNYRAAQPLPGWRDLLVGGLRLGVTQTGKSPACPAA